jgi:hypothetical protein
MDKTVAMRISRTLYTNCRIKLNDAMAKQVDGFVWEEK